MYNFHIFFHFLKLISPNLEVRRDQLNEYTSDGILYLQANIIPNIRFFPRQVFSAI